MLDHTAAQTALAELHAEATRLCVSRQLEVPQLLDFAERMKSVGGLKEGAELYKQWIARHPEHPVLHAVLFNYGVVLSELGDQAGAVAALRAAVAHKPDFFPPHINLGSLLEQMGLADQAVTGWLKLLEGHAGVNHETVLYKAMILKQLGRILENAHQDQPAEDAMRQSLEIQADQPEVIQHYLALRQRQCKWPMAQPAGALTARDLVASISPLSAACYTDDPLFQLANALNYNKRAIGLPQRSFMPAGGHVHAHRKPGRIRVGYISSDLREHAVGFGMTEVLELHDKTKFEVFVYYCGIPSADPTHQRSKAAVEHWLDLRGLSDEQAAERIAADGVDILIDLNGYTKDARTKVFAMRPAAINVNWFGYPGTMGTPYHHYLIADDGILPQHLQKYVTETVVNIPCYQPNDRRRPVSEHRPSRAELGLPQDKFVFCSLNGMQKINPRLFAQWLRILKAADNSVLWLLGGSDDSQARLRAHAEADGIDPARLIFADKRANPDHLARYPAADLFLDTFPYGSHTTAADALWMGVPMLTWAGRSFAARVCSSLVSAAGIPEMVAAGPDDYERMAIAFANDPASLKPIRKKLEKGRDRCALFDTAATVRHLEGAYARMMDDWAKNALPKPDIQNLDVYHQMGLDLDLENNALLSDDDYRAAWRQRIAFREQFFPMKPDGRMVD